MNYTKRERIEAVLKGQLADRPPITAYRHFPKQERDPKDLAEIMTAWQKKYDWDIMKIHPAAVYMQEVFGEKFDYQNYYQDVFPTKIKNPNPNFSVFDVKGMENLILRNHVKVVEIIRKNLDYDMPILHTLFTPLQIISGIFDCPFVRRHYPAERKDNFIFKLMREHEEELLNALSNVTQTYINYWKALKEAGADGFFYAGVSWAREGYMQIDEWKKYVEYFDKKFLSEVKKDGGILMYHTCGIDSNVDRFIDYPIDILHWDQGAINNPSIKEAKKFLGNITPMGGVNEMLFGTNSEKKILEESQKSLEENKSIPFILAPYCSVSIRSSEEELNTFRNSVNLK